MRAIDIAGQRFGYLVAIRLDKPKGPKRTWLCHCDCGNDRIVTQSNLRWAHTKSCGCRNYESGPSSTIEHKHWSNMISRCKYETGPQWKDYGGRGIKVCERWKKSFANFISDVGPRPGVCFSLDRFPNNDGDYEPGNVRWATAAQQSRNSRRNRIVTIDGESMPLVDAVEKRGLKYNTILYRLRRGWTEERALQP